MNEDESAPPPATLPPVPPPPAPPLSYFAFLLRSWALRSTGAATLRHSASTVVAISGLWLALWVAIDRWDAGSDAEFYVDNTPLLAWYALAILGLAALLRARSKPAPAFAALLVLALGLVPVPLLLFGVAADFLSPAWLLAASIGAIVYSLTFLARGLRTLTGASHRAAAAGGVVFVAGFLWLTGALDVIPTVWAAPPEAQAAKADAGSVNAEALLFEQPGRIDRALNSVKVDSSAPPRSFFLGFAGVGDEKVFAQEIGLASRVLTERYAIAGRGLSLINDERDLERAPLASVTGLKYALRGLGSRMNRDRDVLFLAISSHGDTDATVAVSNSQLPLDDLTDGDLSEALEDSGIKWRVIIVSACYAGAFIDSLKNPQTIVITAAAADRTSFGCSNDRDLTYFGEAFYRDALPEARSLRAAFETAKAAIGERERLEHVTASKPQAYFGSELEAKLAAMNAPAP